MSAPPAKAVVSELDGDAYSIGRAVREAIFVVVLMVILAGCLHVWRVVEAILADVWVRHSFRCNS
eukprot:scaffold1557_cov246-Pinguiococcus_pyrenoidosus.AAC.3